MLLAFLSRLLVVVTVVQGYEANTLWMQVNLIRKHVPYINELLLKKTPEKETIPLRLDTPLLATSVCSGAGDRGKCSCVSTFGR